MSCRITCSASSPARRLPRTPLTRSRSPSPRAAHRRNRRPAVRRRTRRAAAPRRRAADVAEPDGARPARYRAGVAVESVWRDLHDPLLRFITRRVPDRASAEDILQEVMLRLHRHADEIRHVDSVSGWIHTISRNAITDYYRAAARRELPVDSPDPGRRARRSCRRARTGAAPGRAHRLSGAAAGAAVTGAPGGAAAHRPRRPDPGRGRCPARAVDVGHEVAGAAGPQPAAGPVHRLLRHPPRPPRWGDRLPAPRWRRLRLWSVDVTRFVSWRNLAVAARLSDVRRTSPVEESRR